jgi:hypothetical protein
MKHLFLCLAISLSLFSCNKEFSYGNGVLVDKAGVTELSQEELNYSSFLFEGDSYWIVAMKNGDTINAILTKSAWKRLIKREDLSIEVEVVSTSGTKGGFPVIY